MSRILVYQIPSRLRPKFVNVYLESGLVGEFIHHTRRPTVLHLVADYHLAYDVTPGNGSKNRNCDRTGLYGVEGPMYIFALEPGCGRLHDVVTDEVLDILRILRDSVGGISVPETLANARLVELGDGEQQQPRGDDGRDEEERQQEEILRR